MSTNSKQNVCMKFLQRFRDRILEKQFQEEKWKGSFHKFKHFNILLTPSVIIYTSMIYISGQTEKEIEKENCIVEDMHYLFWMTPICIVIMQIDTLLMKYKLLDCLRGGMTLLIYLIFFSELSLYQYQNIPGLSVDYAACCIIFIITLYVGRDILKYWEVATILITIGNLYFFFRHLLNQKASIYYLGIHIVECGLMSFVFYTYESAERKTFLSKQLVIKKEKEWKKLITLVSVGVIVRNNKKEIKFWNQTTNTLVQEREFEEENNSFQIATIPTPRRNIYERITDIFDEKWKKRGLASKIDHEIIRGERTIYLEICRFKLEFEREECKMYILKDITLAKEVQFEISKTAQEKDIFFASMSHELRNPLNALLGCIEILRSSSSQTDMEIIDIAVNCGETLLNLIGNILDVSKIENQKLELTPSWGNLIEAIAKDVLMFSGAAKKKGIYLKFIPNSKYPQYFMFDHTKFNQVIVNILGNAIKFTDKGGIRVTVDWYEKNRMPRGSVCSCLNLVNKLNYDEFIERINPDWIEPEIMKTQLIAVDQKQGTIVLPFTADSQLNISENNFDTNSEFFEESFVNDEMLDQKLSTKSLFRSYQIGYMKIHIIDTGIGLSEDDIRKLFQPFSQTKTSRKKFGGTGLGLWISENLIKLMGGSIEIVSQKGLGSSFVIVLPLQLYDREVEIKRQYTLKSIFLDYRYLIVDDEDYNRKVLAELLGRNGASTFMAENGEVGLEVYKETMNKHGAGYFHAIMTDLRMPIMSGQKMIMAIRRFEKASDIKRTPIIVISGDPSENEKVKCLDILGANAFISKPLTFELLQLELIKIDEDSDRPIECNLQKGAKEILIFVIDDDQFSSKILTKQLENNGLNNYITAFTAHDAIHQFNNDIRRNHPDITIILLDSHLPDADGPEIATHILKSNEKLDLQIGIFGLSGDSVEKQEEFYWESNCALDKYFQKPIEFNVLLKAINEVI